MHSPYAASINTHFSKLLTLGQQLGLFLSATQYLKDQENTNQNSNAVKSSYKTVIRLKGFGAATEKYVKPNCFCKKKGVGICTSSFPLLLQNFQKQSKPPGKL